MNRRSSDLPSARIPAWLASLAILVLSATSGRAEDVDTGSHPDTVRAYLSPYSIGLGAGAFASVNSELAEESEAFLKLSLVQSLRFGERLAMGLDVDWFGPGGNWGGDMSVSFLLGSGGFQPFVGAGAGFHYFDSGENFGEGLGPSAVAFVGMQLDVLDELQMRLRIPFHYVANESQDRAVGLDVAILLGSPVRNKRVKKLIY